MGERIFQERSQEKAERAKIALETGIRPVGDASADEKYREITPAGFAKKIRPDFGLEHKNSGRSSRLDRAANTKRPVEGKIDDRVGKGHTLTSKRLPGDGRGGDNQWSIWISILQMSRQRHARESFADGYGVNPDGTGSLCGQFGERRKGKAESLP